MVGTSEAGMVASPLAAHPDGTAVPHQCLAPGGVQSPL